MKLISYSFCFWSYHQTDGNAAEMIIKRTIIL